MKNPPMFQPASARSILDQSLEVLSDLLDKVLNVVFAFDHETARLRSTARWVALFVIWLFLAVTARPAAFFTQLENEFINLLAAGDPQNILIFLVKSFFLIVFNLVVVRHLLALYVPYWFMRGVASVYLADIFEKDEKVALAFIRQAAFAGSYNSIHIRQGKVAPEDQNSPMIQFGGPGYVIVELDSAVVVEKPDGSTRVIGPTNNYLNDNILTGFERIRQGLDLRDIIQKQEVSARSRDGIPVSARDVQYSYSIYRGPNPVKSPKSPYPFDTNAVLNLVYNTTRSVKLGEAPVRTQDWLEPLPGKTFGQVGGEMGGFISKRGLSEFLAAVGKPENDNLKETGERIRAMAGPEESQANEPAERFVLYAGKPEGGQTNEAGGLFIPYIAGQAPAPNQAGQTTGTAPSGTANGTREFVSRSTLTSMFYDHIQANAAQRGTQLNWIGVGTWDTPAPIIPKNHLEAWKISRENFARGNPGELKHVREDAKLHEIIRLTRTVAIREIYVEKAQGIIDEQVIINVLKEYLTVLDMACDIYRDTKIPSEILDAISKIKSQIYPPAHDIYGR